jgi:septal ring factor EnvC (AmiA/AmiB activator)
MAHTRSQDLEARFNTLQSSFLETQKEVKRLSATIASIDSSINATINTTMQSSMEEVKQELTTQLESVFASLCTKLKIPTDDHFSEAPPKTEGEHSSHSHTF